MMHGHLVLLAAFFLESQPPARTIVIVIVDFDLSFSTALTRAKLWNIAAMSARSRKPATESFGIESSSVLASSRLQTGVLPFLTTYFGPRTACRIRWCDLPNDQKIAQHPHRSEFLLNGRLGSREVLNPG